jgi:hypothetical protein
MQLVASPSLDRILFFPVARNGKTVGSMSTKPTRRRHQRCDGVYDAATDGWNPGASCSESVQNPLLFRPRCRPHPFPSKVAKEHELGD